MATTYTYPSFNEPAVGANTFPGVIKRALKIELDTATSDTSYAFVINDIIKVFALPPYVKILSGKMVTNGETDDHATPTVDLDLIVTDGVGWHGASHVVGWCAGSRSTDEAAPSVE